MSPCPECLKRLGLPKKYHPSMVEWKASYLFHHIRIDFVGLLLLLNGSKHILVIGDHFTKCSEAILLPDQTAVTTANVQVDHWISRFGCPKDFTMSKDR